MWHHAACCSFLVSILLPLTYLEYSKSSAERTNKPEPPITVLSAAHLFVGTVRYADESETVIPGVFFEGAENAAIVEYVGADGLEEMHVFLGLAWFDQGSWAWAHFIVEWGTRGIFQVNAKVSEKRGAHNIELNGIRHLAVFSCSNNILTFKVLDGNISTVGSGATLTCLFTDIARLQHGSDMLRYLRS